MISRLLMKINCTNKEFAIGLSLFLIFGLYYSIILIGRIPTDLQPHAKMAFLFAQGEVKLPPNFLYFFLLALFTGFSDQYSLYYIPTVFLLSMSISVKFFVTKYYSDKFLVHNNKSKPYTFILAIAMLYVFALPGLNFYLSNEFFFGQLVSNVWHNSTVIFLMPFSILLFFKSYYLLFGNIKDPAKEKLQIILLLIINALIKPSFLFTLLPAVGIFFVFENFVFKNRRISSVKLLPYLIAAFFIIIEYYFIYKLNFVGNISEAKSKSSVIIDPFVVWRIFSPDCLIAFLTSCIFPLVFISFTKGKILRSKLVQFALVNYVIGLIVWILFSEQGFRKSDGNFYWQIVVVSYLLFFTMLIEFINAVKLKTITKVHQWIIGGSFLLHFCWGVFYWVKIIIFKDYS
jgi:hypothetical protein